MRWVFLIIWTRIFLLGSTWVYLWKGPEREGLRRTAARGWEERSFALRVCLIVIHAIVLSRLYIRKEIILRRFAATTLLFVISIIILIIRDSFFLLLLGWDGLGASSFYLIVWYQRWTRTDRGIITLLSNRLGDFFLLFSVCIYFFLGCFLSYRNTINTSLTFLFATACLTKRAQFPFRVWLPLAIRAPTPISALVHSSTLVTAGIFLRIKLHCLVLREFLFFFGVITIVVAGTIRVFEADLKKVVALSTLSQLGLICTGIGRGLIAIVFFHIIAHAFTKRALLIVVGTILYKNLSFQDKRLLSWRGKEQTGIFFSLCTCSFSLCGISFTSGRITKELLTLLLLNRSVSILAHSFFLLGVSFTFIYCFRLIIICKQYTRTPLQNVSWTTKEITRSTGLVVFTCIFSLIFSERLFLFPASVRLNESLILLSLLLCSFIILWLSHRNIKLCINLWGGNIIFNLFNKLNRNQSRRDRSYIDQINWKVFWWRAWVPIIIKHKNNNLLFFLLLILLLWRLLL